MWVQTLDDVILTVLETKHAKWVPSPTGIGIAMLVPFSVIVVMFLGSVADRIWHRTHARSNELYMVPLASGLIAGEALIAVIIPLVVVLGLVGP